MWTIRYQDHYPFSVAPSHYPLVESEEYSETLWEGPPLLCQYMTENLYEFSLWKWHFGVKIVSQNFHELPIYQTSQTSFRTVASIPPIESFPLGFAFPGASFSTHRSFQSQFIRFARRRSFLPGQWVFSAQFQETFQAVKSQEMGRQDRPIQILTHGSIPVLRNMFERSFASWPVQVEQ